MKVKVKIPSFEYTLDGEFTCADDVFNNLDYDLLGERAADLAEIVGNPEWVSNEIEEEEDEGNVEDVK